MTSPKIATHTIIQPTRVEGRQDFDAFDDVIRHMHSFQWSKGIPHKDRSKVITYELLLELLDSELSMVLELVQ